MGFGAVDRTVASAASFERGDGVEDLLAGGGAGADDLLMTGDVGRGRGEHGAGAFGRPHAGPSAVDQGQSVDAADSGQRWCRWRNGACWKQ